MGVVVDTSAIVDLERAGASWTEATLAELADEPIAMPAIVLAELLVGIEMASTPADAARRRARVDALRARVPVVQFDEVAAAWWAQLRVDLAARGEQIPANDLAVAASARALGFGVLVGGRDEAHFRRIPGLVVHRMPT